MLSFTLTSVHRYLIAVRSLNMVTVANKHLKVAWKTKTNSKRIKTFREVVLSKKLPVTQI